jgi:probable DNA metabolism protein
MRAVHYSYDGTFEGLLTVAAFCVRYRSEPLSVLRPGTQAVDLFAGIRSVSTDLQWSERAWKAMIERTGEQASIELAHCHLAELAEVDLLLVRRISQILRDRSISYDPRDPVTLALQQWERRISHEVHHMHAFVRFQENSDGTWTSVISPAYDVLPLIAPHFRKRYADMKWMILDERRGYALYFDGDRLHWVEPVQEQEGRSPANILAEPAEKENAYRSLWLTYFHHVNIPERKNLKLQMKHMAKRHWRHMVEMAGK